MTILPIHSASRSQQQLRQVQAPPPPPDPLDVQKALDDTLDLSSPARNLFDTYDQLDRTEKIAYLQQLARLLQAGIVGTETLEVRGAAYESFVGTRFIDPTITHARLRD